VPSPIDDGSDLYLFTGEPVAYFEGRSVYSFLGRHLGWYGEGWVRDHAGRCVLFTDSASVGGPPKPGRQSLPPRAPRAERPLKAKQEPTPPRPDHAPRWSDLSPVAFLSPSKPTARRPTVARTP
jgi:hypothetical protein